ncbi:hydroxymethylglutaryl-CoA lyase [Rhodococcus fascians]|uniref:hydroxymethylglutaryl-CoA lyase n=1 Tax=Rhodococcoides fascians TaxID=1828 RepID=UPI00196041AF|nr:hydroxymethylglutaryl-CoA lyase [Rhodococcus fascians]MBM7245146.1 hydroxymethylglutaryl-CoA lyase [Rhodococcus fascians]MBY3811105.1 hydroxymethylglutaryl-CoA lyase [Rhodococcus fascians]MBY3842608.1 hydroxymethylglutaryl-CoA lyase [Rhodococcus fascians]MBY3845517.1 hydroxymethylglutaryl-CoA lyase [Rhodococcus fascians]MBY3851751.1 hydroxymethylglutaryl-CoA lyase [Rhodococcus fascians]
MTPVPDAARSPRPDVHRDPALPAAVRVYEVGPRDGLQAEPHIVPTATKVEFCRRLVAAGVTNLELTSFVSPRWVPQLVDAEDVMAQANLPQSVRQVVLAPNARGLDRALTSGASEIAVFVSATETFAQNNLGTSVAHSMSMAETVVAGAAAAGAATRGYVSMCFGDPWEGSVDPVRVADVAERLIQMGVGSVSLGDTIGVATPAHVHAVLDAVVERGIAIEQIALHLHDTYGQALTNVYAGLLAGVTEFDSSAGGLGRCPYARGATGNLATEDLVWMLDGLGIDTGIDLHAMSDVSLWLGEHLDRPSTSAVVRALSAARTGAPQHGNTTLSPIR